MQRGKWIRVWRRPRRDFCDTQSSQRTYCHRPAIAATAQRANSRPASHEPAFSGRSRLIKPAQVSKDLPQRAAVARVGSRFRHTLPHHSNQPQNPARRLPRLVQPPNLPRMHSLNTRSYCMLEHSPSKRSRLRLRSPVAPTWISRASLRRYQGEHRFILALKFIGFQMHLTVGTRLVNRQVHHYQSVVARERTLPGAQTSPAGVAAIAGAAHKAARLAPARPVSPEPGAPPALPY